MDHYEQQRATIGLHQQLQHAARINFNPHIVTPSERQELSLILGRGSAGQTTFQIPKARTLGPVRRPSSYWSSVADQEEQFLRLAETFYPSPPIFPSQAHSPTSPTMCPSCPLPPPSPPAAHAHDPSNDNCMCVDCYDLEPVPPGPPPNTTPPLTPPRLPQRRAPRRPEYLRLMDAQLAFRDWHHIPVYFPTSTRQMLMFSD